ncbi:hypothetical protein AOLI_G00012800 [Acnodon oligacanthus]
MTGHHQRVALYTHERALGLQLQRRKNQACFYRASYKLTTAPTKEPVKNQLFISERSPHKLSAERAARLVPLLESESGGLTLPRLPRSWARPSQLFPLASLDGAQEEEEEEEEVEDALKRDLAFLSGRRKAADSLLGAPLSLRASERERERERARGGGSELVPERSDIVSVYGALRAPRLGKARVSRELSVTARRLASRPRPRPSLVLPRVFREKLVQEVVETDLLQLHLRVHFPTDRVLYRRCSLPLLSCAVFW